MTAKTKTMTQEQIKESFFANQIFKTLKDKYPDRDYDLEFELMCEWYKKRRKRLPQLISAFRAWLSNSKPDPQIILKREIELKRKKEDHYMESVDNSAAHTSIAQEKLSEIRKSLALKLSR